MEIIEEVADMEVKISSSALKKKATGKDISKEAN